MQDYNSLSVTLMESVLVLAYAALDFDRYSTGC